MRIPPEYALLGDESDCRNRTLHQLFLMIGLGERAGSGVAKIKQGWTDLGCELALKEFYTPFEQTLLSLYWHPLENTTQETHIAFSKTQQAIVNILRQNPNSTRQQIAEELNNITVDGVKYQLKKMQELGFIIRVGANKGGYWKINKD